MKKFKSVESLVIPLALSDVDTDMIIPAQFLTSVSREGYGENLFRRFRDSDPQFVFNQPRFADAKILVADSNFGCGSSREHAVWALQGRGIEVVIAKSFADIFTSNRGKNGLVFVSPRAEEVDQIVSGAASGDYKVKVDLESQSLILPDGKCEEFPYESFRKHCILNGLDDIDYILSHGAAIKNFREGAGSTQFFTTLEANH